MARTAASKFRAIQCHRARSIRSIIGRLIIQSTESKPVTRSGPHLLDAHWLAGRSTETAAVCRIRSDGGEEFFFVFFLFFFGGGALSFRFCFVNSIFVWVLPISRLVPLQYSPSW